MLSAAVYGVLSPRLAANFFFANPMSAEAPKKDIHQFVGNFIRYMDDGHTVQNFL
jgi:hypothetical protein